MEITALVENTSVSPDIGHRHGLSFYIKTPRHQILFDLGPDQLFLDNAEKCSVDVSQIDTVVISHGHDDHGGGLPTFLAYNKKASVYLHQEAFEDYYAKTLLSKEYIGLERSLKASDRIILTGDMTKIDKELLVFSDISGEKYRPAANKSLLKKSNDKYVPDTFEHEQNLLISSGGRLYLFAGCAHSGIINILEKAEDICGCEIDFVFGGFHLYNPDTKKSEKKTAIREIAAELMKRETQFYTCHCTGQKAYKILKEEMGDQIHYIKAGMSIKRS